MKGVRMSFGGVKGNRTLHSFLAKESRQPWNM